MTLTSEEKLKIGGSDVAAIMGLSPYKAPIDVWRRCVGEAEEQVDTLATRRGTLIEPVIRELAKDKFGLDLQGPRKLSDPSRPYVRASLDDVAIGMDGPEVIEFKSVGRYGGQHYADGQHPMWHECQVQFYLSLLGAKHGRLIALFGVDDLEQYPIEADTELQAMIFDAVDRFWESVKSGTPPEPDSSESYTKFLAAKFPHSNGQILQATAEAETWAAMLREARATKARAEEQERQARNWLAAAIGEADGMAGKDWKISYKTAKGRAAVDWEAVCFEAQVPKSIIEAHTSRKPYRIFKPTFNGVSNE